MQKCTMPLLIFQLVSLIYAVPITAQPGPSPMATRFHFREIPRVDDSSNVLLQVPNWFIQGDGLSHLYLGAVNRYGLVGLTEVGIGGMVTSGSGLLCWQAATSGDAVFRGSAWDVGWVKRLSSSVWFGTSLGFSFTNMKGYGSRWVPAGSISAGGVVGDRTFWGLRCDNPHALLSPSAWYGYNPMGIRAGVASSLSTRLSVYGGLEWVSVSRTSSLCKFTYRISSAWKADVGWGWGPDQLIIGLHRLVRKGWMGLGFSQDPVLGSSFSFFSIWDHPMKK